MTQNELSRLTRNAVKLAKVALSPSDSIVSETIKQREFRIAENAVGGVANALIQASATSRDFREALLED